MAMLAVARRDHPFSDSHGTDGSRKNFELDYLLNRQVDLPENSKHVSGDHDLGRGCTGRTPIERCS